MSRGSSAARAVIQTTTGGVVVVWITARIHQDPRDTPWRSGRVPTPGGSPPGRPAPGGRPRCNVFNILASHRQVADEADDHERRDQADHPAAQPKTAQAV